METAKPKVITVLGPTASGKTAWSLRLAQEYDGEIVYADSRQIYRKMDIGTAKPAGAWRREGLKKVYMVNNIPHHLVDFLDPGKRFSVAEFKDRAIKIIRGIVARNKLPIIVGGTGLYISALMENLEIPRVAENRKLRKSLEEKTLPELCKLLNTLDPAALRIVDLKNKRRVIRALEVCIFTGEPFSEQRKKGKPLYDACMIGIAVDKETLSKRIDERVNMMMKLGLIKEIQDLLRQKYSWELPSMNGIGYQEFKEYFEGTLSLDDAIARLKRDTRRYARRQRTWFLRDKTIRWVHTYEEARELADRFLGS